MIDFSKIDLSTIEPNKTEVVHKSVEVTSKGTCMGEFNYYATGVFYTTSSGKQLWDDIFIRFEHPNMGMSWEFEVKRDYAKRVKSDKMNQYVFAIKVLEQALKQHQDEK
jgi:hypothetical protein